MALEKGDLEAIAGIVAKSNEALVAGLTTSFKEAITGAKPAEPPKNDPPVDPVKKAEEDAAAKVAELAKQEEQWKKNLYYDEVLKKFDPTQLDAIEKATYEGMLINGEITKEQKANWVRRLNAKKTLAECEEALKVVKDGVISKSLLAQKIEAMLADKNHNLEGLDDSLALAVELKNNAFRDSGASAGVAGAGDIIAPKISNGVSNNQTQNGQGGGQ